MTDFIDVWRIHPLRKLDCADELRTMLSSDERARADQITDETRKKSSIVSRAILRLIISDYAKIPAGKLILMRGQNGKPYLEPSQNTMKITFNFSDSGDMALLAVGRNRELGVDLEKIRPVHRAVEIAGRRLALNDADALNNLEPEVRDRVFLQNWACYEALVKARGGSVLGDQRGENLTFSLSHPYLHEGHDFTVRDLDAGREYVGALAAEGKGWQMSVRDYSD